MSEKALTIVHVGNHTTPCTGGIENVLFELSRVQAKQKHTVKIVVFNTCANSSEKLPSEEKKEGVTIHRLPCQRTLFYMKPLWGDLLPFVRDADIIHVHGFGGWLDILARHRKEIKGKIVLNTHGGFGHTQGRKVFKAIYRKGILPGVWPALNGVVFDSEQDQLQFPEYNGFSRIIAHGVSLSFRSSSAKKSVSARKRFVVVGRLSKNKRVEHVIDAFTIAHAQDSALELHIIGEDWEGLESSLKERASKKGISTSVIFHGKTSQAELEKTLLDSAFFVSGSEYEGFGISVIEAMTMGCIPCLNDIPTFRTFAGEGRGIITSFEKEQVAGLEMLRLTQETTASIESRRKKCIEYSRSFDWEVIGKKMIDFYRTAPSKKSVSTRGMWEEQ